MINESKWNSLYVTEPLDDSVVIFKCIDTTFEAHIRSGSNNANRFKKLFKLPGCEVYVPVDRLPHNTVWKLK